MYAEDLMTRAVHTCRARDTLADAARKMWDCDVGWLPVLDDRGELVSVVTDRDVCMGALHQGSTLSGIRVESVMSPRLVTCFPGDDMADVEEILRTEQLRRLPVVDEHRRLAGVVTLSDVVRGLEREIDEAEQVVKSDREHRSRTAPTSNLAGVSALADVVDRSRALYQSCSHALEATETLAKISEPRRERFERVDFFKKAVTCEGSYVAPDGDDVWIHE
jgi:CBS-domain-containing membrane protein